MTVVRRWWERAVTPDPGPAAALLHRPSGDGTSVAYRELAPPRALEPWIECLWERLPVGPREQRVVPDGCVDLMWLAERELVIAGADTESWSVTLPGGARTTGARLRPGAAGAVLGVPAHLVRDQRLPASTIWGGEAERLETALRSARPARRLVMLAEAVARRGVAPDAVVVEAARRLALPGARVHAVARDLGVSERALHRRTRAAVGYGPKVLGRVARLRRLVVLDGLSLAQRAYEAGYASQAHMGDEVRRLTGTTPVRFLEDAATSDS